MYKNALIERTFWLALCALAIWGAQHAGCRLLLTRQAEKRKKQFAKELDDIYESDRAHLEAVEKEYCDGWTQFGKDELARYREAVTQERAELAARVYVPNMVRQAVDRVVDKHYEGVAKEIQEWSAATLAADEQTRRSVANTKDMEEDLDINAEAFRHYGFRQGSGGSWVLPSRIVL